MPGYRRHFSSSRYKSQSHSRTKRGWFCLVPSKLDSRSVQCSTTAGLCVVPGNQPQPSNVIAGISRRGTRPGSVWIQCASASCPHNARQRCWRLSAALCWPQRTATLNTNDVLQYRKRVNALTTTMFEAQPIVVTPWHPATAQRHTARGGHWARAAKPRRCQHEATLTVHRAHRGTNRGTAAHKTGLALYTLSLRAWRTDTAPPPPPALGRHRAQSHSRTKRGWFGLVPSKLDPRLARCSTTAGHCVAPGDQPRPFNVILGSTRRWMWPGSVATQRLHARCPHTTCQRRWLPKGELCWRQRVAVSNVDHAQQRPQGKSTSPTTVLQAQSTLVAPRQPGASLRHNARDWQWAHKGKPHHCWHEATLTVHRAHRGTNRGTAAHKTGFALHTVQLRARATDAALPQPPALCRHRAQSHSRTKKASYAWCNPGRFPGQTLLNHPYSGLATTTVGHRQPRKTTVAQRQRPTPETRRITLAQCGIWTLCSSVRAVHSLAMPEAWAGTPWRRAAATRRRPRSSTARPMIATMVVTPLPQHVAQAVDSVSPRQPPCLPQGTAAVVPPRPSAVLCPASRTGNLYTVPVIRCIPKTLTKAPHRDTCRVVPAVCAVPRARHAARMTPAGRWRPGTARSTTAYLTPLHTGEAAQ